MNTLMTIVIVIAVAAIAFVGMKYFFGTSSDSLPSYSYTEPGNPIMGGARKLFRGKKMSRVQSTGAFLVVVSALIYSLYRSAQHFLLLTGR
jgi:hypothetical protein